MLVSGNPQNCAVHHYGLTPNTKTPALVLIHGWLGSSEDWLPVIELLKNQYCIFAIDLTGHGNSQGALPVSYEETVDMLSETVGALNCSGPLWAYGYSLGGRLVLGMYHQSNYIQRIFLESAHLGLHSQGERAARLLVDKERANRLSTLGLKLFLPEWYSLDIFSSLQSTPERLTERIERRLAYPAWGAAELLVASSLANQPPPRPLDPERVTLISGALDEAYTAQYKLAVANSLVRHVVIPGAGHAAHEENPTAIVALLRSYLRE
jgi:2-succinyl-6-hydroxy-2,4-cyclohexadiene-1-carboxylate synthase